jgi:catechol 2,3-dioxygenase-like lactoylglutathione lyase family enzyme
MTTKNPFFIDHVKLTVKNFDTSKEFYSKLFRFLNVPMSFEAKKEKSLWQGRVMGWGDIDVCDLEIQEGDRRYTKQGFNRERIGLDHIAFTAPSKKHVDRLYLDFLKTNKVKCWKPRKYPYSKNYYAVFFLDPDGILLEYAFEA